MYTVLGVQASKGVFNDFTYDNVKFHCCFESTSEYVTGSEVEIVTIPRKVFESTTPLSLSELLGKNINVAYNKKGKLLSFEVIG